MVKELNDLWCQLNDLWCQLWTMAWDGQQYADEDNNGDGSFASKLDDLDEKFNQILDRIGNL